MKSCTACKIFDECTGICTRVESLISPAWSTSLHELALGSVIEIVPSSQAYEPPETTFPYFPELRPLENSILRAYYVDGQKTAKIAQRYRRKKNTVKSIIARIYIKIRNQGYYK